MGKYIDKNEAVMEIGKHLRVGDEIYPLSEKDRAVNDGLIIAADVVYRQTAADVEPRWIPCSERLPEEDKEVLIAYRYKEGEGDANNVRIDITSYGYYYFGGHKIPDMKGWRDPFQYFSGNYRVIAWMPLPSPYEEGGQNE